MLTKTAPWHEVLELRPDLMSGELEMAEFAADLYDVSEGRSASVYSDPERFFALTYPTHSLRDLVRNVTQRLAGKGTKAVHQINVTFGGGKTHALIALFHLANDPEKLPNVASVGEFREHSGVTFAKARVAVLPFDKISIAKGLETHSPSGETKRWLQPWTILAYQLAGDDGVRSLHREGLLEESDTPPAEPELTDLLRRAVDEAGAALVLIDEPLMYARIRTGSDETLSYFFQVLTQAISKMDRAALVASLLASDRSDSETDQHTALRFQNVFTREQEAVVVPVGKSDVAEILRRRLFTPESLTDRSRFRVPVVAALARIGDLDEDTKREGSAAEERYLAAYPFHPEFLDVFYAKWTQVQGFQRTRGVLRILALALRAAAPWDASLLVGTGVLLATPGEVAIPDALAELARTAKHDVTDGRQHDWTAILDSELRKAAEIEAEPEHVGLSGRPVSQAVITTFLHSQPVGQRASIGDILRMVAQYGPDRIVLDKALRQWATRSWFLDEGEARTSDNSLPRTWRLGTRPNLKQMHDDATRKVADLLVERRLVEEITAQKGLFNSQSAPSVVPHKLPDSADKIDDDGRFHYAVLGPSAASEPGDASNEAQRFINETTGPDRPRRNRNAIVLAVPSRIGIVQARHRVRELLAWDDVRTNVQGQDPDPQRKVLIGEYAGRAQTAASEAIRQAYSLAVAVSEKNAIVAYKLSPSTEPLFNTIKSDKRLRLTDKPVNAQALLPGGPHDLWREGEEERPLNWIVGAFAEIPALPKFLDVESIRRTMLDGVRDGLFGMRLTRPDGSVRTFWCEEPEQSILREPALVVVLSEFLQLSEIAPSILRPKRIPELWAGDACTVQNILDLFTGKKTMTVRIGAADETLTVPMASEAVVFAAVASAIEQGILWYREGSVSLFHEAVPAGALTAGGELSAPPVALDPQTFAATRLPDAWLNEETTPKRLAEAVASRDRVRYPWYVVKTAIEGAIQLGVLRNSPGGTRFADSPVCDDTVVLLPVVTVKQAGLFSETPTVVSGGAASASAVLSISELQDLSEAVGALNSACAAIGANLTIAVKLLVTSPTRAITQDDLTTLGATIGELKEKLLLQG